ncbi:MAG TPA: RNA polymerase sigma factor [Longimicrobiales bacterium]|nr:RNA polymerase sigma factor [Longimicrobiales bacterium]
MTRASADDERLVARAAAGDAAAFDELARRVLPRLRRWALARTADPDEADEVVQETLIRMHRGLRGFSGAARLSSWLYRILANAANARDRRRRRHPTVADRTVLAEPEASVERADPVASLHARRMAAVVREYFETLPPGQREILELVDHEGMRPVEVAEALAMNPVTVRAHLFRARRALRSRILERYPELMEGYER